MFVGLWPCLATQTDLQAASAAVDSLASALKAAAHDHGSCFTATSQEQRP
jgi:hypothetical protein